MSSSPWTLITVPSALGLPLCATLSLSTAKCTPPEASLQQARACARVLLTSYLHLLLYCLSSLQSRSLPFLDFIIDLYSAAAGQPRTFQLSALYGNFVPLTPIQHFIDTTNTPRSARQYQTTHTITNWLDAHSMTKSQTTANKTHILNPHFTSWSSI